MSEESGSNNRRFVRTRLRAEVKMLHPRVGEIYLHTRDISDGGAYVQGEGVDAAPGEMVQVQLQGLPGEPAPVVTMRVVRVDKSGLALQFVDEEQG